MASSDRSRRFASKVCLVLGGSGGVGLTCAKAFAREGAKVVIVARNEERLASAAEDIGGDTVAISAPLDTQDGINRVATRLSQTVENVDVVFYSVGIGRFSTLAGLDGQTWDSVFNTNVKGVVFLVQALESIKSLKKRFPVLNPTASIEDIQRHVRREPETFACVGGYKYFYLDWNLQIWRCEAWNEPLGSVFDLDRIADRRDRCTACMMNCYRDTSVLMHAGVVLEDALASAGHGRFGQAATLLFQRSVARSLRSVVEEAGVIRRLARHATRSKRGPASVTIQRPLQDEATKARIPEEEMPRK